MARKICEANGYSIEDNKEKLLVDKRNKHFMECNEQIKKRKDNLFYLIDRKSCNIIACAKTGCWLNKTPQKWPVKQTSLEKWVDLNANCEGSIPASGSGENIGKQLIPESLRGD